MNKYEVDILEEGTRIDVFASTKAELSRSKIAQMIKEEKVLLNGQPTKANARLSVDDEVTIYDYVPKPFYLEPVKMDLEIVYEDTDCLVVNKPRGLVVHPGAGTTEPTLVSGLLYHTNQLSLAQDPIRPGIVHRIDKDTSGLLVVAKNDQAHQFLSKQLAEKTMCRSYLAVVHGEFEHLRAKVDAPIGRDSVNRQKMAVTDKNSKPAVTHLLRKDVFNGYSLLECTLETGRTHQIRVHCQYINYPIVGDPIYSYKNTPDLNGQLLHAYKLEFVHPSSLKLMSFECDPPSVFTDFIKKERGY